MSKPVSENPCTVGILHSDLEYLSCENSFSFFEKYPKLDSPMTPMLLLPDSPLKILATFIWTEFFQDQFGLIFQS